MTQGPIQFDLEGDTQAPDVSQAQPVPDLDADLMAPAAMQRAANWAAAPPSRLARWFWGLAGALFMTVLSVTAWQFAASLVARVPMLGWAVTGLLGAFVAVMFLIALREIAALGRLRRVDGLHRAADQALADQDLQAARAVARRLITLYKGREDTAWGCDRLAERLEDQFDASAVFALTEDTLMAPLDAAARAEVEAAARQVATVTALVPMALADVATALAASLRMIRRVAEIYGGRAGTLGSWRLTRAVFAHLVTTGAVAVGDDLLEPVLGGSLLSRLSRRFGEGLVNGALTARVGVAAMEVCRPLPFSPRHRPSVRHIIARALKGFVSGAGKASTGGLQ